MVRLEEDQASWKGVTASQRAQSSRKGEAPTAANAYIWELKDRLCQERKEKVMCACFNFNSAWRLFKSEPSVQTQTANECVCGVGGQWGCNESLICNSKVGTKLSKDKVPAFVFLEMSLFSWPWHSSSHRSKSLLSSCVLRPIPHEPSPSPSHSVALKSFTVDVKTGISATCRRAVIFLKEGSV